MNAMIETLLFLRACDRLFVIETVIALYQAMGMSAAVISKHTNSVESGLRQRGMASASLTLFSQPNNTKQAQEIIETLARSGGCGVVVIEGYHEAMDDVFFTTSLAEICAKTNTKIVHLKETRAEQIFAAEEEDRLAR